MPELKATHTQRLEALRAHLRAAHAHSHAAQLTENAARSGPSDSLSIRAAAARGAAFGASQHALDVWHDSSPRDWTQQARRGEGDLVYLHKTTAAAHCAAARRAGQGQRWQHVPA